MFMSSGHWQNTGLARWINKNLYHYNANNEKSMNPMRWHLLQNDGDVNSIRETINGFPCRLILVNDGTTSLNAGQQEPTPGNTKDMGIFNFNNDKDNVSSLGLDTEIFPNCISYEVTANSDTSAGAFVPYSGTDSEGELSYLQNSFELRYPDSDDVGGDYGYLGMAIQKLSIPVSKVNTHMSSKMSIESFGGTRTFTITRDNSIGFTFYSFDATGDTILDNKPSVSNGSTITVSDNAHYIRFTIKDCSNININGVDYQIPQEYSEEMTNPYGSTVVSQDYGLKRVIDWVGNCTDEEFKADYEKYFNKHYLLRYYLLVITLGMVDNLG